jgi:hypothetical protein
MASENYEFIQPSLEEWMKSDSKESARRRTCRKWLELIAKQQGKTLGNMIGGDTDECIYCYITSNVDGAGNTPWVQFIAAYYVFFDHFRQRAVPVS